MTRQYLVDELNPTGFVRVIDEASRGSVQAQVRLTLAE
jgi:hypothetical protein